VLPSILIQGVALLCVIAASPVRANSAAIVTGAIDFPKNRTSATNAPQCTFAGVRRLIAPANAGTEAALQQAVLTAMRARLAAAAMGGW